MIFRSEANVQGTPDIGTGAAIPYGSTPATGAAPSMGLSEMGGKLDSAATGIGYTPVSSPPGRYRPESGRADRLSANIVGSSGEGLGAGGYPSGSGNII
jgi:hypothetical protein